MDDDHTKILIQEVCQKCSLREEVTEVKRYIVGIVGGIMLVLAGFVVDILVHVSTKASEATAIAQEVAKIIQKGH